MVGTYLRHDIPDDISSDRGPHFTSSLWASLLSSLDVSHHVTAACHQQQSNGMVKRYYCSIRLPCMLDSLLTIGWINSLELFWDSSVHASWTSIHPPHILSTGTCRCCQVSSSSMTLLFALFALWNRSSLIQWFSCDSWPSVGRLCLCAWWCKPWPTQAFLPEAFPCSFFMVITFLLLLWMVALILFLLIISSMHACLLIILMSVIQVLCPDLLCFSKGVGGLAVGIHPCPRSCGSCIWLRYVFSFSFLTPFWVDILFLMVSPGVLHVHCLRDAL